MPFLRKRRPIIYDVAIFSQPSSGGTTFNQAMSGTLSGTGTLVKQDRTGKTGILSTSGLMIKLTSRTTSGSLSSSSSLTRICFKSLAGVFTATGTLFRQAAKSLIGVLLGTGSISKHISRSLAGILSMSGTIVALRTFLKTITGVLSFTGSITKSSQKLVIGILSSNGSAFKQIKKNLIGVFGFIGNLLGVKKLTSLSDPFPFTLEITPGLVMKLERGLSMKTKNIRWAVADKISWRGTIYQPGGVTPFTLDGSEIFRFTIARMDGTVFSATPLTIFDLPNSILDLDVPNTVAEPGGYTWDIVYTKAAGNIRQTLIGGSWVFLDHANKLLT